MHSTCDGPPIGKLFLDRLVNLSEFSQAQEFSEYWPNERAEIM
jgi:hypothetical protein